MAEITAVDTYSFVPDHLRLPTRRPGISAFVRTRNGADFVGAAINSHAPYVDEIIVVYNQCVDRTEDVLVELQTKLGPEKLKIYHYLPRVYPPGTDLHAREPASSPHSVVNYSNFALAQTTRTVAFMIDDDHVAMDAKFARMIEDVRREGVPDGRMACFSGVNLARDSQGRVGVLAATPFAGNGDHGFITVDPRTHFVHDRRFETLRKFHLHRVFIGFAYWHLKFLKAGKGFANYELDGGANRRFERKMREFQSRPDVLTIAGLSAAMPRLKSHLMRFIPYDKWVLFGNRALAMANGAVSQAELDAFVHEQGLGDPLGDDETRS